MFANFSRTDQLAEDREADDLGNAIGRVPRPPHSTRPLFFLALFPALIFLIALVGFIPVGPAIDSAPE